MAWIIMQKAILLVTALSSFADRSSSFGGHLWMAMWCVAWDESAKVLSHRIPFLSTQQRRSRWQVLVSLSSVDVLWRANSVEDGVRILHQHANIPRPNIPLLSTSAACIINGLFQNRLIAAYTSSAIDLLQKASVGIMHFVKDGASANAKALAIKVPEFFRLLPNTLVSVGVDFISMI
jgi:hypothetical protein